MLAPVSAKQSQPVSSTTSTATAPADTSALSAKQPTAADKYISRASGEEIPQRCISRASGEEIPQRCAVGGVQSFSLSASDF